MSLPRHPIYIPSKGRWQKDRALTIRTLQRDGVPFYVVVEPQEAGHYAAALGLERMDRLLVLPFSNLGLGSIPSRNWIRGHAEAAGHAYHWQLDDNIREFRRLWKGLRIPCSAGVALRVCEDLAERYSNVGVAGLNYQMFVTAESPAYRRNVHVYSCTLVNHAMPYPWRGRLNEDTDLCLQALSNGWTTLLLSAFMADKMRTMVLGGGNTDDLYGEATEGESNTDTLGRYEMARSLELAWPGIVKVGRRFGRYQHTVNWGAFQQPLKFREGFDPAGLPDVDEYGLELRSVRTPDSPQLRRLLQTLPADLATARAPDEHWRGLPAFIPSAEPPKLTVTFPDAGARDQLVQQLGVTIAKKTGDAHSAWWPPRPRQDLASLRWEPATTHAQEAA